MPISNLIMLSYLHTAHLMLNVIDAFETYYDACWLRSIFFIIFFVCVSWDLVKVEKICLMKQNSQPVNCFWFQDLKMYTKQYSLNA